MRKILLVIDMQNDFIDGALGTLEAEAIIDKVVQVIYKYPLEDIIATRDTHGKDYLETQEGRSPTASRGPWATTSIPESRRP